MHSEFAPHDQNKTGFHKSSLTDAIKARETVLFVCSCTILFSPLLIQSIESSLLFVEFQQIKARLVTYFSWFFFCSSMFNKKLNSKGKANLER